ncbi:unnamed protein product, partial [Schistosoma curassoni]|uniref:CS domain-containing protein n=1 Tax=Schistosoma curassoni TaxID=6186 RepID=A0A183JJ67_9TREM
MALTDVRVEIERRKVSLYLTIPTGDELLKKFQLLHEVVPEDSSYRVTATKIEIKLKKADKVCWSHLESQDCITGSGIQVRHRVFWHRDDNAIDVTILKHRLRWLGHVLRMSSQRILRRASFADSGTGWKKRRGGQCMTWCRGMKESYKGLASVGPSRLPGWGLRDGA